MRGSGKGQLKAGVFTRFLRTARGGITLPTPLPVQGAERCKPRHNPRELADFKARRSPQERTCEPQAVDAMSKQTSLAILGRHPSSMGRFRIDWYKRRPDVLSLGESFSKPSETCLGSRTPGIRAHAQEYSDEVKTGNT